MELVMSSRNSPRSIVRSFGPGIVWAAAAIGSGELIVSAKAGTDYGLAFAWALVLGCALKYVIHRAILDVSLATGRPIVDDWHEGMLGKLSSLYWLVFFIATATGVAGLIGLSAAAAHALAPALSIKVWAVIVAFAIIALAFGRSYERYEKVMLAFGFVLFVGMLSVVAFALPSAHAMPMFGMPEDSTAWLVFLALLGWGAGSGPDLMLPYSWWVAEKRESSREWVSGAHVDLIVGYVMTACVAVVFMLAGAFVLAPLGVKVEGIGVLKELSSSFTATFGAWAAYVFFVTAFVALFSTALGVFDGGRIALAHIALRVFNKEPATARDIRGHAWYRATLVAFSIIPLALYLGLERPVILVLIAGAISALSMPILAFQTLTSLLWVGRPNFLYYVAIIISLAAYTGFAIQALRGLW